MNTGKPIDLLADRTAETLRDWLLQAPSVVVRSVPVSPTGPCLSPASAAPCRRGGAALHLRPGTLCLVVPDRGGTVAHRLLADDMTGRSLFARLVTSSSESW